MIRPVRPFWKPRKIRLRGFFLDSSEVTTVGGEIEAGDVIKRLSPAEWEGQKVSFDFRRGTHGSALVVGCYELEDFGVWTMTSSPLVIFPMTVSGEFVLSIEARAFNTNVGREITFGFGDCTQTARFEDVPTTVDLLFSVTTPTQVLSISGIDAKSDPNADDPRSLGVGLSRFSFRRLPDMGRAGADVPTEVNLSDGQSDPGHLAGFHPCEPWGAWTAQDLASVGTPRFEPGKVAVHIEYMSHPANAGRNLALRMADATVTLPISDGWEVVDTELTPTMAGHVVELSGWLSARNAGTGDPRKLGIGIRQLTVRQLEVNTPPEPGEPSSDSHLTSRGRPRLSKSLSIRRKVFLTDISNVSDDSVGIDVISAFLWAFKDDENSMLFVVSSARRTTEDIANVLFLLSRVGEIKCRVIVVPIEESGKIPSQVLRAADVFLVTTPDHITTGFARDGIRKGRRAVLSLPKTEEALTRRPKTVYVPMLMRPEKIYAERFGYRRGLINAMDWGRLATAIRGEGERLDRRGRVR